MEREKKYKNLAVDPATHESVKIEAAKRGLSIKDFVTWLLKTAGIQQSD